MISQEMRIGEVTINKVGSYLAPEKSHEMLEQIAIGKKFEYGIAVCTTY
jgi:hypothetical protein